MRAERDARLDQQSGVQNEERWRHCGCYRRRCHAGGTTNYEDLRRTDNCSDRNRSDLGRRRRRDDVTGRCMKDIGPSVRRLMVRLRGMAWRHADMGQRDEERNHKQCRRSGTRPHKTKVAEAD